MDSVKLIRPFIMAKHVDSTICTESTCNHSAIFCVLLDKQNSRYLCSFHFRLFCKAQKANGRIVRIAKDKHCEIQSALHGVRFDKIVPNTDREAKRIEAMKQESNRRLAIENL